MTEELDVFRDQFRRYLKNELAPRAEGWRKNKITDRDAWRGLGAMGALLASVPETYGGLGATFADRGRRDGGPRHRGAGAWNARQRP